jgi:hypothetical protein
MKYFKLLLEVLSLLFIFFLLALILIVLTAPSDWASL